MSDAMTDAQKLIARLRKYSEPNTSITIRDPLDEAATDAADWITAALAEIAALRDELAGFIAVWAVRYAEMMQLPSGSLHSQHYDRMKELGCRMDDFTRSALAVKP